MPEKEQNKKQDNRARYWGFIAYPESVAQDWEDILSIKYGFEWARSPLHDRDFNDDGTPKKSHWHCLIYTGQGKKSYKQIKEICDEINATAPQIVHNPKGNVRYFLHKDNPEKAQYMQEDMKAFNGFDIFKHLLTDEEAENLDLETLGEIYAFIEAQGITEFHEINTYARLNNPKWFKLINKCFTWAISTHLKSIRHDLKERREYGKS